jgi:hypothetical protein
VPTDERGGKRRHTQTFLTPPRRNATGLFWLFAAVIVGASGVLQHLRPPAPQLILFGLTAVSLALWRLNDGVRAQLERIDLSGLVALHLARFVGFYFLFLYGRGELPYAFAVPAGWGDVAVASGAAILLLGWNSFGKDRRLLLAWNSLGLLDILFVVASAARAGMAHPASMAVLLRLPLNLLLTFVVPLIIASHIVIFSRLRRI